MNLNELAKQVHAANIKWWRDIETGEPILRNRCELLMLIITELSEACEGERKNLMDDKLPHRRMAEVEMADAYIRLLDFAAGFDIELDTKDWIHQAPPINKGESLFRICASVYKIEGYGPVWVSVALHEIESYCAFHGYDLAGARVEKMAYNATREDHKHEARALANGKKW